MATACKLMLHFMLTKIIIKLKNASTELQVKTTSK